MQRNQETPAPVLVTGGSGYLAGWTIVELLRRGQPVRATTRSRASSDAARARIAGAVDPGNHLEFVEADLTSDEGWDQAVKGCEHVIHVASPMPIGEFRGLDAIGPARDGTLRVLRASHRAGVRRVVMTSSLAAALPPPSSARGRIIDETTWTDPDDKSTDNYAKSKVLAEHAAWDLVAALDPPIELSVVLPGFIQGPVLDADFSGSVELVARLLSGKLKALPRIGFTLVDVRDVVDLHLRAMTEPHAAGERFIAASEFMWLSEIASIVRDNFPERARGISIRTIPDTLIKVGALVNADARFAKPNLGVRYDVSAGKAYRLLGWTPRPATESLIDAARSLLEQSLA